MRPGRGRLAHPVAGDAATAVEAEGMVAVAGVAATAADAVMAASAEAINARNQSRDKFANSPVDSEIGQGWIRTSEGVKPADLQSAPFGHFGTYPLAQGSSYILALHSLQLALTFAGVDSSDVTVTF